MAKDERIQEAVERHAVSDMADVRSASQSRIVDIDASSTSPSTSSVLWASWRQGLKDLQTAVLGAWGGTHEEAGGIANPVQREVYEDRHGSTPSAPQPITAEIRAQALEAVADFRDAYTAALPQEPSYDASLQQHMTADSKPRERGLSR